MVTYRDIGSLSIGFLRATQRELDTELERLRRMESCHLTSCASAIKDLSPLWKPQKRNSEFASFIPTLC